MLARENDKKQVLRELIVTEGIAWRYLALELHMHESVFFCSYTQAFWGDWKSSAAESHAQ